VKEHKHIKINEIISSMHPPLYPLVEKRKKFNISILLNSTTQLSNRRPDQNPTILDPNSE